MPALTEIVEHTMATLDAVAKPIVHTVRPCAEDEDVAAYLEEISTSLLACLQDAHANRGNSRTNVLVVIERPIGSGEAFLAAHMALGSIRQMIRVAANEMGPLDPPIAVNGLVVRDPSALPTVLERLLGATEGYINGEMLTVG